LVGSRSSRASHDITVQALCTNRDLPLSLSLGQSPPGSRDFDVRSGVPADAVRCIVAPTAPSTPLAEGALVWRFLSHLSVNYLSLNAQTGGVDALRELLELYAQGASPRDRQVNGIHNIAAKSIVGPFPAPGPRSFVRGLEVRLECEERSFGGHHAFTLASVLARLFARYASTSSFAQTVLSTRERGEVYTFPALPGLRHVF
jgi:type VI secretion system protein ImpG